MTTYQFAYILALQFGILVYLEDNVWFKVIFGILCALHLVAALAAYQKHLATIRRANRALDVLVGKDVEE